MGFGIGSTLESCRGYGSSFGLPNWIRVRGDQPGGEILATVDIGEGDGSVGCSNTGVHDEL